MTPQEPLTIERIEELRRMTPEQRLMLAEKMYWDARLAKAIEMRVLHPDWSEDEVQTEVKWLFLAEAMKEC